MMIAETLTQCGVLGGELRSNLLRVPLVEGEATMSVLASPVPWEADGFIESFSFVFV
jgi:hypothetical protein